MHIKIPKGKLVLGVMVILDDITRRSPIQFGNEWFQVKPVLEVSPLLQVGVLTLLAVLAGFAVLYAFAIRKRQAEAVWICLGALLCSFYEPVGDLHAQVTYHELGQIGFWTAFGFQIPLWVMPTYVLLFGLATVLLMQWLARQREIHAMQWAGLLVAAWLGSALFEIPLIAFDFVRYYADPGPVSVLGFPLWIGFVNGATVISTATCATLLCRTMVFRQRPWLFMLAMPTIVVGMQGTAALPIGSVQNGNWSGLAIQFAAVLSIAIAVGMVAVCAALHRSIVNSPRSQN